MIKIGDTFEVVRILSDGGFSDGNGIRLFTKGDVASIKQHGGNSFRCCVNYPNAPEWSKKEHLWTVLRDEVNLIGRLTVTKVK